MRFFLIGVFVGLAGLSLGLDGWQLLKFALSIDVAFVLALSIARHP